MRRLALLSLCLAAAGPDSIGAGARPVEPAASAPIAAGQADGPNSPRASLSRYLELCRQGRYREAARYLVTPEASPTDAATLARRLKMVLDRHVWFDLERVSPDAEGDTADHLPPLTDEVGAVPSGPGRTEALRLVRVEDADGGHWAFAPSTVARIDTWYGALEHRFVREHLPEILLRPGPRELLWWQWLALPVLLALAWGLGRILAGAIRAALSRAARRTRAGWDDALLDALRGPLVLGFSLAVTAALVPGLSLYAPAQAFVWGLLRASGVVTTFWALWRAVDVVSAVIGQGAWSRDSPSARSLLAVGGRAGKAAVLALGVIATLAELGFPVASLVAGLGLGGLALALAAQKTVENLFGSLSLAVDQPVRVGDFVRVEDFVGTVEAIGLRSTRVRTLDRTLITIPNGRLADMRLESFSARDRMRLACTLGLVYDTTAAQMRRVLAGLEAALRAHPQIWPDAVVVRFKEFGASSLDIEVMAWFQTPEWSEFQLIRQEVLLQFMEVVERAGTSFAFPTQTVHLTGDPAAARPRPG